MHRRAAWLALPTVGVVVAALAAPAAATRDVTGPYGHFGFITQGLGRNPSYGEPSMVWAPDGRHGVICTPGSDAQGNGTVQYWYTSNAGKTWKHSESTAPRGGGDCNVDYLPGGVAMSADLEVKDSAIAISKNWGASWTEVGTAGQQQDRQWFAHSADGHTLYLVYHDFAAEAEWFAKGSYDPQTQTVTWPMQNCCNTAQSANQASAPGVAPTAAQGGPSLIDEGGNTFSGPLLVDPSDKTSQRLYVIYSVSDAQSNLNPNDGVPPYGPTRAVIVAYSGNGGLTWTSHYAVQAPQQVNGANEPSEGAIFPWGSVDQTGTLYVVYNSTDGQDGDHYHQYYKYSKDHGATWSKPIKLDTLGHDVGAAIYANSAAAGHGLLDVVWYESKNGTPSSTAKSTLWTPYFAQVTGASTGHPHIISQPLTNLPNHRGGICLQGILCGIGPGSGDRSLLDFFQVGIDPHTGQAGIAYADNAGYRPGGTVGEVVFALQTRYYAKPR
jgi:hypothetical protein